MTPKLNTYLVVALAVVLAIIAGLGIYGTAQRKAYLEAKGAAAVLEKQYVEYSTAAESQLASIAVAYSKAKAEKDAALAAATVAKNAQVAIQSALDAEKAKTHALPPDSLSGAINTRIGANQSWPTEGGVFTFTRPGTESVLNRFLNGEASESKYQAGEVVTVNLRAAIDAAERGTASISGQLTLTKGELDKCVAAKDANAEALKHLERSILGTKIKTFVVGAGVGAATLAVLHFILKII
jgi:hypothetical protein